MFEPRPLAVAVAKHVGGGTPSRQVAAYWNGQIPWASVKDFADGGDAVLSTQEFITAAGLGASASNLIPAGTPLVCTRMAVGRSAVAPMPVAINQDVKALSPAVGTSAAYLLRLLQYVQPRADAAAVGSTVKGIRIQDYLSIAVPMAPSEEQGRIAEILDTLDITIRQTEAIIEKLKQVKQGLLHDLLTHGIDANGELRPPKCQAPHLYKDSPLGSIPREWHTFRIKEICALGRGRVISQIDLAKSPGPYPVYSSQTKNEGIFGHLATYDFDGPHVTWTTDGANAGTVFYRDGRFNCTNVCGTLAALVDDTDLRYLALALSRETSRFVSRVGNDKLMNGVVAEIQIPVPPPSEQLSIADATAPVELRMRGEQEVVEKLALLKAGLMDDLLTGHVRVTPLLA